MPGMAAETGERRVEPRIPVEMWVEETTGSERYFRRAGDLCELGAVRDQRRLDLEFFRDAIAVGFDAILQFDFGLRERNVIWVAARATR